MAMNVVLEVALGVRKLSGKSKKYSKDDFSSQSVEWK